MILKKILVFSAVLLVVVLQACNTCKRCENGECIDGECVCNTSYSGQYCDIYTGSGSGGGGGGGGGGAGICFNYCQYANDGECDDGGPGSAYSICDYGSDCADCGTRY